MSGKPKLRKTKTKIVATIGPACDSIDVLKDMIRAGMNVARLNLSFDTYQGQKRRLERIRTAARELEANLAIMVDTKGIEIRTGKLSGGPVELLPDQQFILHTDERVGDAGGVYVSYRGLPEEVTPGTPILLDDGAIELVVESASPGRVACQVVHGGILGEYKSVNLPATELLTTMTDPVYRENIINELNFAVDNRVDYVAASFVQTGEEVRGMRALLKEKGADIPIIAKIENRAGVENLEAIVEAANGVMVARGDLGVELPLAELPSTQKRIIRATVTKGKPVITATQMLASMENSPKPTRAEASDVANAILDGTSAIMLSGETASGKYPVEAVKTMVTLALRAEASLREYGYLQKILPHPSNVVTEAVSQAATAMASHLKATAIISLTSTGFTSCLISKYRPDCPILAITNSESVMRALSMNWGVIPLLFESKWNDEEKTKFAIGRARELGYVCGGDIVVVTAGSMELAGGTDLIRVVTLPKQDPDF